MAAPYSYDLRTKALEALKRGERKSDVCRMLKISRNTLDLWLKREEQTGDYRAITNFQKGCRHKITDWDRFGEFARKHGGKTQAQLAWLWGEGVRQQNISDALHKIGLSRKKKRMGIENETKASAKCLKSD
jgi:transposase